MSLEHVNNFLLSNVGSFFFSILPCILKYALLQVNKSVDAPDRCTKLVKKNNKNNNKQTKNKTTHKVSVDLGCQTIKMLFEKKITTHCAHKKYQNICACKTHVLQQSAITAFSILYKAI